MRRALNGFVLAALILGPATAVGASRTPVFEGSVKYHSTEGSRPYDMIYFMQGQKYRMETSKLNYDITQIVNLRTRKIINLMHELKIYALEKMPGPGEIKVTGKGKMTNTGNTGTILGRSCEEWLCEENSVKRHIWFAKGFGTFAEMFQGKSTSQAAWVELAKSKGLIPLKIVTDFKGGKNTTMEAIDITERPLSPSLFEVTPGFKETENPEADMGKAMKNAVLKVKKRSNR
jgi:hypothetical protein